LTVSGLGETLRRERVNRQLALEEIACSTKISTRFLHAIETEDFGSLPGLVFTRNFVRQYATYVELDPEPLLAKLPRFDLDSAPLPDPPARKRGSFWSARWSAALAPTAWTLLAVGVGVAAYFHFGNSVHPFDTVRAAVQTAVPKTPRNAVAQAQVPVAQVPVAAVPAATAADRIPYPVEVVLAAKEESWVSVAADGKNVFSGLLKAGETKTIGAEGRVALRTGNAGGIEVSVNGKALDPLGPTGRARSVTLTAAGLQLPATVTAVQNPPTGELSPL
jgi:hypothetical protein